MDAFLGSIFVFGFDYAPANWAPCNGQSLLVSEYPQLFALIGTTYGGEGSLSFGLPNLQGRVPIGAGQGPGLSNYPLASMGGSTYVTLTAGNLPPHTHAATSSGLIAGGPGDVVSPDKAYYGVLPTSSSNNMYSTTTNVNMKANSLPSFPVGGSSPISMLNPYMAMGYYICTNGIWPTPNT